MKPLRVLSAHVGLLRIQLSGGRHQRQEACLPADVPVLMLQAPLSATTTNGMPSITATFTEVTSGIASVAGNEGHPEMRDFVKQSKAGPASLQIAFVPQSDGDSYSDFVISSGVKLLSSAALVDGGPCTCPQQCLLHAEARCVVTCSTLLVGSHRIKLHACVRPCFKHSAGSSGRKLLATAARAGRPGYAAPRYY